MIRLHHGDGTYHFFFRQSELICTSKHQQTSWGGHGLFFPGQLVFKVLQNREKGEKTHMSNYGNFTYFLHNPYGFLRYIYAYLWVIYGLRIFYGANQYENQVFHLWSFLLNFPIIIQYFHDKYSL